MKLTYIIATREKPHEILKTVEETLPKIGRHDTKLLICIDSDDKETVEISTQFPKDERIIVSIKDREDTRGEKYDRALTEAPADVYLVGHDCVSITTPAFDQIIINAARLFPDGIGVVCTPMFCASFPGFQAVTAKWVDLVGYIYSHEYPYWFIDHELDDLCRMTGRYVFVDVDRVERRPANTMRLRDVAYWTTYYDTARFYRRDLASKIIDALDEPEWRKLMLKTWYHPVDARSDWINADVRANADHIEKLRGDPGPPDFGYLRIRSKADVLVVKRFNELKERLAA